MNLKPILYNINAATQTGTCYIRYTHHGQVKRFPTKKKFSVSDWSRIEQQIAGNQKGKLSEANDIIYCRQIFNRLRSIIESYNTQYGILPTIIYVENELSEDIRKPTNQFFPLFEQYLTYKSAHKKTDATIRNYTYCKDQLKDYQIHRQQTEPHFEIDIYSLDANFFAGWKMYLHTHRKMQDNTVERRAMVLKEFLKWAKDKQGIKHNANPDDFKVKKNKPQIIALNRQQLDAIRQFTPPTEKLKHIRHLILIGAQTGLRYSDLIRLSREHIKTNIIQMTTDKTNVEVFIPISKEVSQILTHYNFQLPRFSLQKANDYIKELCELIPALQEQIEYISWEGQTEKRDTVRLCDVLSTHCVMRKTFINICIQSGIPLANLQKYTGIQKLETFRAYLDRNQNEHDNFSKAFQI